MLTLIHHLSLGQSGVLARPYGDTNIDTLMTAISGSKHRASSVASESGITDCRDNRSAHAYAHRFPFPALTSWGDVTAVIALGNANNYAHGIDKRCC